MASLYQEPTVSSGYDYQNANRLTHAGISQGTIPLQGIDNLLYGNLDYSRDLQKLGIQNQFNASEAQKNRDFQERMSNSAYSRAVSDLKSVGVNPYAAISGMNAASTPSGSSASSGAGGAAKAQGLSSVISNAFALAATVLGIGSKREIAQLNADALRDVANINAASSWDIATRPDYSETLNYNNRGRLTSKTIFRKRS